MHAHFFENKECEYYPCHEGLQKCNCLFCFCPLYPVAGCGGNFVRLSNGVKDCSGCTLPHRAENYDYIISQLTELHKEEKNDF